MTTIDRHVCACAGDFTTARAEDHYPPDLRLEPIHLDIDLFVDLENATARGHVAMRLRANDAGVRSIALDAVGFHDVAVDGASHAYDGRRLVLAFETPFAAGEERRVMVRYRIERPPTGLTFSKPTDELPDLSWFAVTDHETERARYWLPTIDLPNVRPTLAFRLRAQQRFTILANGRLLGEEAHEDGTKTVSYVLDHPCPSYLTCFAIGDFVRFDGGQVGDVEVAAFAPRPFEVEHLARTFAKTADRLRFFERFLGVPYPFPKYYQFAAMGIGGAMENISLVSWDDRFVLDADLEREERRLIDVVDVHEMAHAWFGDHVVCRDFAHAWLKESWATYMETVWLEQTAGRDARDYDLYANALSYFRESDERYKRPIVTRRFDSSWDMYDMHLYPGGAWRLHMLRVLLGDEVFWPAVGEYLRTFGRGTVETDDFRRVLERRSGRSLVRFFEQWLRAPGFPELCVSFEHDAERGQGVFTVEQKQVDEKAGVPAFDLDLEVAFRVGSTTSRRTLSLRGTRAVLAVPMDASPDLIVLDPDQRVLARIDFDPGVPRLLTALREGPDVRTRIEAGKRLVKSGTHANAAAVRDAFESEPFWGVRLQWADALGDARNEPSRLALVALLATHDDPEVLPALMRAAGKYRDEDIAAAVLRRVERGLLPRALEAAYEALGAQRERADTTKLLEGTRVPGWGGFAQAGALRALGATRRAEALEPLLAAVRPGAIASRVRPAACAGLGALARFLDGAAKERAVEALVDRLQDPDSRVRAAASAALCAARATDAMPALRAYRETRPAQEQVRLDRAYAELAKGEDGALRASEKKIESLEKDLRGLEARLDKLEARSEPAK